MAGVPVSVRVRPHHESNLAVTIPRITFTVYPWFVRRADLLGCSLLAPTLGAGVVATPRARRARASKHHRDDVVFRHRLGRQVLRLRRRGRAVDVHGVHAQREDARVAAPGRGSARATRGGQEGTEKRQALDARGGRGVDGARAGGRARVSAEGTPLRVRAVPSADPAGLGLGAARRRGRRRSSAGSRRDARSCHGAARVVSKRPTRVARARAPRHIPPRQEPRLERRAPRRVRRRAARPPRRARLFRARRRADDAHPAPDRAETLADARELLRRLRADGAHPSTAHAAAHIDRLLRERETLLRRLSAARARPSSPSTPLSLRTRAAVARVRALTPENKTNEQTENAREDARGGGAIARRARPRRRVPSQGTAIPPRDPRGEGTRARRGDGTRAEDGTDTTKPEDDDASRASSDDEHASECDRSVSVDLSVDESASTADGLDAGFATTSPVRVFLRVASTSRATSPASSSGSSGRGSRVSQDSESQVADSESVWTPEMRTIRGAACEAADALLRTPASELLEIGAASKKTGRGAAAVRARRERRRKPRRRRGVASRRSSPEYDEVDAQRMQRARSRVTRISPTRAVAGRRPL